MSEEENVREVIWKAAIEDLERRLGDVERSVEQPSHDKLFEALAKAQAEIQDAVVDAEADAGPYKYKYATLAGVLSTVRPVLSKHGLAISQLPSYSARDGKNMLGLTTILGHKSGQSIEDYFEMFPPKQDPQGIGSAMTYMRRYVVMAMCGIAGASDDDAAAAQPEIETISPQQLDAILNLADELFGDDAEATLQRMCDKVHNVESVRDIPANEYDLAMKRLNTRAAKLQAAPVENESHSATKSQTEKPSA